MLGFGPLGSAPLGAIPQNLIVELNHHDVSLQQIADQLSELRDLVARQPLSDENEVAVAELDDLQSDLAKQRVRLKSLMEKAGTTLPWVVKMAAGGAIAKIGAEVLTRMAQYFGVELS